jgi:hypothetical protein
MGRIRFKANIAGFREIRYSEPVQGVLEGIGLTVMNAANSTLKLSGGTDRGYEMTSQPGKQVRQGRWRVSVAATAPHAIRHNAKYNTLLRALGGGQ